MRVLYVIDSLATGGAEINLLALIEAMSRLGVRSSVCTLCVANEGYLAQQLADLSIERFNLDMKRVYDLRAIYPFLRFIKRERFDVVHVQDPYAAPLGVAGRWVHGTPVVYTRHVTAFARASLKDRLRANLLIQAIRCSADRILAVSGSAAEALEMEMNIAPEKIVVINNGIRISVHRSKARQEMRNRMCWSPEEKIILMVGVMRSGKGHQMAIAAFEKVQRRFSRARLVLAGDGPLRREVEHLSRMSNRGAISILGDVRNARDLMQGADVLILPSESEAYPNVLLEAADAGLPAVGTAVGGIPEIIADGVTGLCVEKDNVGELANALITILEDDQLRRRMGFQARARAEQCFAIEKQAEKTLSLYRSLPRRRAINNLQ